MSVKVAINGFGRIGRNVFRQRTIPVLIWTSSRSTTWSTPRPRAPAQVRLDPRAPDAEVSAGEGSITVDGKGDQGPGRA